MMKTVSRAELHREFTEELKRTAPAGSAFVFEIERKEDGSEGCNWYPLASMASWRGDVMTNLAAFRAVREHLSARYRLEPEPAAVPST
ncbi:MAG TPA: hypothetical protein VFR81_05650 [Longimicrobium sp.]|nr:hypothetical protein [Longimicrobium sp.]